MKYETKKTNGKEMLSVEIPADVLARFREHVRARGGRMGFDITWLIEGMLNGSFRPPATNIPTQRKRG